MLPETPSSTPETRCLPESTNGSLFALRVRAFTFSVRKTAAFSDSRFRIASHFVPTSMFRLSSGSRLGLLEEGGPVPSAAPVAAASTDGLNDVPYPR